MGDENAQNLLMPEHTALLGKQSLIDGANAFKSDNSAILSKGLDKVALGDAADITKALDDYAALSANLKAMLESEYQQLTAKDELLETVAAFKSGHAEILGKTLGETLLSDAGKITAALSAYGNLNDINAQNLLASEYQALTLKKQLTDEAEAFNAEHSAILSKALNKVVPSDGAALSGALDGFAALSAEAKTLLSAEYENLTEKSALLSAVNGF